MKKTYRRVEICCFAVNSLVPGFTVIFWLVNLSQFKFQSVALTQYFIRGNTYFMIYDYLLLKLSRFKFRPVT